MIVVQSFYVTLRKDENDQQNQCEIYPSAPDVKYLDSNP